MPLPNISELVPRLAVEVPIRRQCQGLASLSDDPVTFDVQRTLVSKQSKVDLTILLATSVPWTEGVTDACKSLSIHDSSKARFDQPQPLSAESQLDRVNALPCLCTCVHEHILERLGARGASA